MSINLHISADSAKDFFQHLSELSAGFYVSAGAIGAATVRGCTAEEASAAVEAQKIDEPAASPEPKAARKPRAAKTETPVEEKATADTVTAPDGSTEIQTSDPADAPQETNTSDDEGREGPYPDFDTQVTPVVLGAVRAKGKEWVAALLGEFGVEKASQLKDAQFQELIDTINERMQ